jgi:hypothetical protein
MSVLHDIKSDVLWVIQTLQTKGITDDVYSVLENIVQKTDLELPVSKKPAPLTTGNFLRLLINPSPFLHSGLKISQL